MSGFLSEFETKNTADETLILARYDTACFKLSDFDAYGIPFPDFLAKAVTKRQSEFLAGRVLAKRALEHLGCADNCVGRGNSGEPLWPDAIKGSITHSHGRVGVLATSANWLPGLDIEHIVTDAQADAIKSVAMTETERTMGLELIDVTALFSAKEALFKGLFPVVGRRFGFSAAELVESPRKGSLRLKLTKDLTSDLVEGRTFSISLTRFADRVMSRFGEPL